MADNPEESRYRLPESFYADLEKILTEYPDGISEYDLLRLLKQQGYFSFSRSRPAPPSELFQMHFLLFHGLYRLQQECQSEQRAILEVNPLSIRLREYSKGDKGLTSIDPVRAYYLDLSNLIDTSHEEVLMLLETFWRELARFDCRTGALAELGLSDPVTDTEIKQTYRRLAMEHHPDRGGESWRLQAINAAYAALCK
ncbi:MAG: DNA-J related domain-containing protein [Thiohalophilus sp.]|jgi:hypothetical protein